MEKSDWNIQEPKNGQDKDTMAEYSGAIDDLDKLLITKQKHLISIEITKIIISLIVIIFSAVVIFKYPDSDLHNTAFCLLGIVIGYWLK